MKRPQFRFLNCWKPTYGIFTFALLQLWGGKMQDTNPQMTFLGITVLNFGFEFTWIAIP